MTQDGKTDTANLPVALEAEEIWTALEPVQLSSEQLARNRVVSASRHDPAHMSFDMLRTRLLLAMRERGWSRIAVSSPTEGCGKTFVAANLAVALARRESCRTVLMDMDLRTPGLARMLGVSHPGSIAEYLSGHIAPEDFLLRAGPGFALALNDMSVRNASELLAETMTSDVLDEMQDLLMPEMVIFDLPSVLENDDMIAFLPNVDGVLLVAAGGITSADEVLDAERALGEATPLLGVVFNRAEGEISY
ncbi:Chromosome partitioning ATPase, Mrp family, contains Fe-S cluster [Salinihabitans flavidus]|uniref:Chromosome partitioning ATPase, Mrp family, contains Fe-S cluster n=1 Tax=Salinihabitans flavidus TaxID=569882 RepID=A0A1H8P038_9RHOB|nr:CpsD/CapB family tyrosine-protein kinase [Salinihabitans flavidus]SEO34938.1 Chromosome partitioning ATPase, Mrp family, contains Fe-S cluster [Salinihabitans flavidus]